MALRLYTYCRSGLKAVLHYGLRANSCELTNQSEIGCQLVTAQLSTITSTATEPAIRSIIRPLEWAQKDAAIPRFRDAFYGSSVLEWEQVRVMYKGTWSVGDIIWTIMLIYSREVNRDDSLLLWSGLIWHLSSNRKAHSSNGGYKAPNYNKYHRYTKHYEEFLRGCESEHHVSTQMSTVHSCFASTTLARTPSSTGVSFDGLLSRRGEHMEEILTIAQRYAWLLVSFN